VNRLKDAQIAQIDAVIAANEKKTAAELTAIDTATRKWEAMAYYYNGQLTTVPPSYGNGLLGPSAPGGLLGVPPPPVDPFGIGNFFNGSSLPPPRESGSAFSPSASPTSTAPTIVFSEGSVVVGDIASTEDVFNAVRAAAAALFESRTGVAA
jgi:hypothetical protein